MLLDDFINAVVSFGEIDILLVMKSSRITLITSRWKVISKSLIWH